MGTLSGFKVKWRPINHMFKIKKPCHFKKKLLMEEHHNAKLQVWTLFGLRTITIPQEQKHHTANPELKQ